jgi:Tol biopolymer transport system component
MLLRSGKMTVTEMLEIASSIALKETGIKLGSFNVDWSGGSDAPSKNSKGKEVAAKAMAFTQEALRQMLPQLMSRIARLDLYPVWSADGKSIAFVRGAPDDNCGDQLIIRDLTTGKERVLVDHSCIECISWTKGGKLLVTQARRLMSRQDNGLETESEPGYPEIWLLEPR